jgi:alcohol dehydrogenase class IV
MARAANGRAAMRLEGTAARGAARACSHAWTSCSDLVGIPKSLAAAGVAEKDFEAAIPEPARAAFEDPSLRTNLRMPLLAELVELLRAAFRGRL